MLWSFPFAFLLAAFLLVLFLRQRKAPPLPERVIGSLALWQQLASRRGKLAPGNRWWQRPGLPWWVAGLVLLILSAAGPLRWSTGDHTRAAQVLVVDNRDTPSASLFWKETAATAAKIAASAHEQQKIAIVATAPRAHVAHPFSTDSESLCAAIHALLPSPSAGSSPPSDAIALAAALPNAAGEAASGAGLLWISGALSPTGSTRLHDPQIQSLRTVPATGGISLEGISLSRRPERPGVLFWQAGIRNNLPDFIDVRMEAGIDKGPATGIPVKVPPGACAWRSGEFPATFLDRRLFHFRATPSGEVDGANFTIPMPKAPHFLVVIVADSSARFWEAAFASMPGWTARVIPSGQWQPAPGADLWVLIGVDDEAKVRRAIELAPAWLVESVPFAKLSPNTRPKVIFQAEEHPVIKGAHIDKAAIAGATSLLENNRILAASDSTILADSAGGPLLIAGEPRAQADDFSGHRWLAMAFRPEASNLPLRASFPVLVEQGTLWLLNRMTFANDAALNFPQPDDPGNGVLAGVMRATFSTAPWWSPALTALGLLCLALSARQISNCVD